MAARDALGIKRVAHVIPHMPEVSAGLGALSEQRGRQIVGTGFFGDSDDRIVARIDPDLDCSGLRGVAVGKLE
ncbi:MAG: hypothetical protein ACC631_06635 [Halocynthiibacter sp.]